MKLKELKDNRILVLGTAFLLFSFLTLYFNNFFPDLNLLVAFLFYALVFFALTVFANAKDQAVRSLMGHLKDKEELISIASHEISSPLTNIKGTLSVIAKEVTPGSQIYLQRAMISVENLISLVDGLLTVSRFEMGKMKITPCRSRIEDICQDVVNQLAPEAAKLGLPLEYQKSDSALPEVMVDPQRIREVLVNFVSNALKYTAAGKVTVATALKDGSLVVSVNDTGPGIKPEDLKLIFNRFVRLAQSNPNKGTGLGLYISRLIVEAHKGRIWAESKVGQGSTFYFSLPLA